MDAFGIFEGGGAKGLAYTGALKAAEDNGVRFIGVAGTSAGSIVAALVAAGFSADELYSPNRAGCVFSTNYLEFFGHEEWDELVRLKNEAFGIFGRNLGPRRLLLALNHFACRNRKRLLSLSQELGFLNTLKFEEWLDGVLCQKLKSCDPESKPSGPGGTVAFRDLPIPLKIIASELKGRCIRVFPTRAKGDEAVAAAVAASISIPIVFVPKSTANGYLVDGGVLSNFPAWVFDRERESSPPFTPTFGFRLVSPDAGDNKESSPIAPTVMQFLEDLFHTSVFGDNSLQTRDVAGLHEVPLRVRIGTLDFDVDDTTKANVYRDGKSDANDYFRSAYVGPRDPLDMKRFLQTAWKAMRNTMKHNGHLRVNVMLPVDRDTLKVVYCFKMDSEDDCDDRIEFKKGSGACGLCWTNLDYVLCDLEDAKETYSSKWRMDKYQQRLVRHQLKSLLCVPIFNPSEIEDGRVGSLETAFLGVLNFDSDDRVLEKFAEEDALETARNCAGLIASLLLHR